MYQHISRISELNIIVLFLIICCFLRFQSRTSEAAKLEAEVSKAQETIKAAEVLISQLDREHRRWNAQVCLGEKPQNTGNLTCN